MAGSLPTIALTHAHSNHSTLISLMHPNRLLTEADGLSQSSMTLIPLNIHIAPCPNSILTFKPPPKSRRNASFRLDPRLLLSYWCLIVILSTEHDHVPCAMFHPYCGMFDSFPLRQQYSREYDEWRGQRLGGRLIYDVRYPIEPGDCQECRLRGWRLVPSIGLRTGSASAAFPARRPGAHESWVMPFAGRT